MKHSLIIAAAALCLGAQSCKDVDAINEAVSAKKMVIQDSLATVLPNWKTETVFINEDRTRINIIVTDVTMYDAPADKKQQKAEELAKLLLRIFGKDHFFEEGDLILTKDPGNNSPTPADGVSVPMPISALKKAGYPG